MKNNKGFTLVEIIVCIALISIIGVSSTIIVIKTKNKNNNVNILNGTKMSAKLSNITNKILQAANVYIAVEKDGNGNTYETGIKNGGKGLYIKVQTLVDNGYLDKSVLDNLKKETDKSTSELQLLAVDAVNKKDDKLCNNSNAIEYTVSWSNDNDKPIYLCPYDINISTKTPSFITVVESTKFTKNFDKMAVSEEWCKNNPNYDKNKIVCNENGIYTYYDQNSGDSGVTYYYARGAINNNYLKFKDKIWRIMWISSDKKMKLVLDDEIQIKINNRSISAKEILYHVTDSKVVKNVSQETYNDIGHNLHGSDSLDFYYFKSDNARASYNQQNGIERFTYDLNRTFSINNENEKNLYVHNKWPNGNYYASFYQYNKTYNVFYKFMYDKANYNENYISGLSEFCNPKKIQSNSSTAFSYTCEKNLGNYSSTNVTTNSKVTYVTLDELKMAGVGTYLDGIDSLDTYILPKNNNSFYLAEYQLGNGSADEDTNYYVSKNGFSNYNTMYEEDKERCLDSKEYYVYYKNGGCNAYCTTSWTCSHVKGTSYYVYQHNNIYAFKFLANAVKPAIIIDLNKINLSNTNSGTKEDPYTLIN